MPDAARGVRQLVLLHGRATAHEMVEPNAGSLVRIASEVLGDEKGRSGYSYSGLCLTSLPHRKLGDDQAWERTVGPLTLIIEPGRIKIGDEPSRMLGVPHGARARLILIYLQTQAVLTNSREVSLGRSMREWMGRMGLSVGGETASALREQARRIATCSMLDPAKDVPAGTVTRLANLQQQTRLLSVADRTRQLPAAPGVDGDRTAALHGIDDFGSLIEPLLGVHAHTP